MSILQDKQIMLGVCGSIAAYKVAELARNLTLAGAVVDVIMTEAAQQFVGPATFQALTGRPVLHDMWALPEDGVVGHVALGVNADIVVIAPATAQTLARIAAGFADDLLTTTLLATTAPVLCAPAMNVHMYAAAATQENIARLRQRGYTILEPEEGRMAEPMVGKGRLPEPATIEAYIRSILGKRAGRLRGCKVVVSAGSTRESIDPLRFISNRSSGVMGTLLAIAARDMGAEVTLIRGPSSLASPAALRVVTIETALQMRDAVEAACTDAHLLIMNAAVADFRPAEVADQKLKKQGHEQLTLHLIPTPDILAGLRDRTDLFRVGFAAETQHLIEHARGKLERKDLDMIIANDAAATVGYNDIQATILDRDGTITSLARGTKEDIATVLIHAIADRLSAAMPHRAA